MFVVLKKILTQSDFLERCVRFIHSRIPLLIRLRLSRKFMSAYQNLEDENKVIFVHVPKAAGNGITYSLFNRPSSGHYFLSKYFRDDSLKFNEYFKFTVVRNPWDRFVSAYHYLNNDKGGIGVWDKEFKELYLTECKSFKEFIDKMISDDKFLRKVMAWTHFIPQYHYLTLGNKMSLEHFDFVCRFETIDIDFNHLKKFLNKDSACLSVVNKSNHNHYRDYYTDEYMIQFVRDLYKEDIILLDYEF
ncbi:sulfotransferase family 2 domain-containing protein [Photobacterium rosenbergii]|uniref:Sulfotransferase family 2 domain-containing protein n=1 Tax=Photobacterium rosenbergii TaxID=294936 RepID=A0ABU3ZQ53_9GAMM|nr:sulfotransferase family 2 domain-containing protein [Photobacterium rosenbergii]MDV5172133.1 sulfotransferase family 2 domain-containing protein [Photobacterium rosenbergii]